MINTSSFPLSPASFFQFLRSLYENDGLFTSCFRVRVSDCLREPFRLFRLFFSSLRISISASFVCSFFVHPFVFVQCTFNCSISLLSRIEPKFATTHLFKCKRLCLPVRRSHVTCKGRKPRFLMVVSLPHLDLHGSTTSPRLGPTPKLGRGQGASDPQPNLWKNVTKRKT